MHQKGFLHKMLSPVMHKKRLLTLILLIEAVLLSKKLSLTELGRNLALPIQDRSGIRRVDRFLGNDKLHKERLQICGMFITKLIGSMKRPIILVDWTPAPNTTHNILRAALATEGRAITLYEEVHQQSKLANKQVHKKFLSTLKELLPKNCLPIIVTDGGYHNEWFRDVLNCGWDYVGRIRVGSGKKFYDDNHAQWHSCSKISNKAVSTPKYVGKVYLCKSNPLHTNLHVYKGKHKGRKSLNRHGNKRRSTGEHDYRKTSREPWIIATSLTGASYLVSKKVMKIYSKRMQIEEGIRDLKSTRYGFSFNNAHSYKIKRIEILLLISMLASFIAWLVGKIGEKQKLHYQFQSNSEKTRRVLSFFNLGCKMIKKKIKITGRQLDTALLEGLCYAN